MRANNCAQHLRIRFVRPFPFLKLSTYLKDILQVGYANVGAQLLARIYKGANIGAHMSRRKYESKCRGANIGVQMSGRKYRSANVGAQI
jgi:hypothetical protein